MKAWELPVLWTRPDDCMCGVVLVHGGGLYRIARQPEPLCPHDHEKDTPCPS